MSSDIGGKWENLAPEKKQKMVVYGIIGGIAVLAMLYWVAVIGPEKEAPKEEKFKPLSLGKDMFEDDISQSIRKSRQETLEQNKAQDLKLQALEDLVQDVKRSMDDMSTKALEPPSVNAEQVALPPKFPTPPNFGAIDAPGGNPSDTTGLDMPIIVGGIAHTQSDKLTDVQGEEGPKKKVRKVFLPASFMQAMLLTGLDASTVEGANAHPQPMMIRVQKPAVLPNSIKANLKGCFVIAHGFGALNKERVESRLVSLNCLAKDGHAVIDSPIKGFVADESDGKSGLKGLVVSKQGAALARVFAAGVLGGFGSVAEAAANTVTIAPTTSVTTTTIDGDKLATAGLGRGISDTSKELRKFYLDLAKQSSPVIEVGPAKKVTVVITEGVWLEIREKEDV